jgi:hypothetical protein
MRKSLLLPSVAVLAAGVAFTASAGAKGTRTIKFTDTVVGGSITDTKAAFSVHDSYMGDGAGVQTVTLNGTSGTDTTIVYYGDATATSKDTFTIGQADANGNAPLTGSGHDTHGTGKLKGLSSIYTFSGTVNLNTQRFTVKLKGTYKLPRR